MSVPNENVLVVRRELFDQFGAFQGVSFDVERYLKAFLSRKNNFFHPRAQAETDPSLKQIIPYAVLVHKGRILNYVRGGKSGEKRLVAKASIGIGGHINDADEGLFTFDRDAYKAAVEREVSEELRIGGGFSDSIVALINDDSNDVGAVHLGVVHVLELESDNVKPGEKAIAKLAFDAPENLIARKQEFETWSQIVLDSWERIHPAENRR